MHEIIALDQRIAARRAALEGAAATAGPRPVAFSLARVDARRFAPVEKGPDKGRELRRTRPVARREAQRLGPVAERTGLVDKLTRRVVRAGKLRLFRLWKVFGEASAGELAARAEQLETVTRPLAERLAWLRRTRRL